jgi:hypothetical protein
VSAKRDPNRLCLLRHLLTEMSVPLFRFRSIYGNGPAYSQEYYMHAALVIEPGSKKRDRDASDASDSTS